MVRHRISCRFAHVSIVAQDWRRLASFYEQVFECERLLPERNLRGAWLEAATNVRGARIQGVHLRLPGTGDEGPTLEIFQYRPGQMGQNASIDRPGLAHVAFTVDNVDAARLAVVEAGGGVVGETVSVDIPGAGYLTFVYAADPEGNIIELQSWSSRPPSSTVEDQELAGFASSGTREDVESETRRLQQERERLEADRKRLQQVLQKLLGGGARLATAKSDDPS